jgi:DNA-binding beta-propeller fold protein YncE
MFSTLEFKYYTNKQLNEMESKNKTQEQRHKNYIIRNPTPKLVYDNNKLNMHNPYGICYDSNNDQIIVSHNTSLSFFGISFNKKTKKNKIRLCFKFRYGSLGSCPNQFFYPCGLCVQPVTNHMIVADTWNHRLQVFDMNKILNKSPSTHPLFMIGYGYENVGSRQKNYFSLPDDVCCDVGGQIIVADSRNHRLQLLSSSGKFVRTIGSNINCQASDKIDSFNYPCSVVMDSQHQSQHQHCNRLLVADHNNQRLSIWDKDGLQHIRNVQVQGYPERVYVDLNGYIYISSTNHTVQIYDPVSLKLLQVLGNPDNSSQKNGKFCNPNGMCVDNQNNLYVCDRENNRLQVF